MSWSFSAIGTPQKISAALDQESANLAGQSKIEFDAAKPHLQGLLARHFNNNSPAPVLVEFQASGSGSSGADGTEASSEVTVHLTRKYGSLLV